MRPAKSPLCWNRKLKLFLRLKRFQLRQERGTKQKPTRRRQVLPASRGRIGKVGGGGGAAQWRLNAQNSIDHFGLAPPVGNKHGKLIVNAFATHASKVPQKCDHLLPLSLSLPSLSLSAFYEHKVQNANS